jgi:hypothetical protein
MSETFLRSPESDDSLVDDIHELRSQPVGTTYTATFQSFVGDVGGSKQVIELKRVA